MRAREFTINIPVNITINGDEDPEISMPSNDEQEQDPVFVSPLQQELELKKAEVGKTSTVIQDLTTDNSTDEEEPDALSRLKQLLSINR